MIVHQRLGQAFAARQHQAARVTTGIRNPHQLEKTRDVLIVDGFAMKLLEKCQHYIRLPVLDLIANRLELIMHTERTDLVPGGAQRGDDVVLCFPFIDLLLAESLG